MASNKTGINNMQTKDELSLVTALLKILAFGIAGGITLLGGAKALGDQMEKNNLDDKFKE